MTKPKRPRDPNQLAKLIVDIVTGETPDDSTDAADEGKDPAAVSRGRKGGKKGGQVMGSMTFDFQCSVAEPRKHGRSDHVGGCRW